MNLILARSVLMVISVSLAATVIISGAEHVVTILTLDTFLSTFVYFALRLRYGKKEKPSYERINRHD